MHNTRDQSADDPKRTNELRGERRITTAASARWDITLGQPALPWQRRAKDCSQAAPRL